MALLDVWWIMPLLAGVIIALIAGPLGSFVVWRRMAFFGDTLAHGALLGITLGVLTNIHPTVALLVGSLLLALLLVPMERYSRVSSDTLLAIISHSTLAVGLITLSLTQGLRVDLMGYLFGDLLAVGAEDVLWALLISTGIAILLLWQWRALLASTVSAELAAIEGYPVQRLNILLVVMLALLVALAMKIVGILLVSALLIIPPATARNWAKTPEQMAILASVVGVLSVLMGMWASFHWDTPAGPSVVVSAMLMFIGSLVIKART